MNVSQLLWGPASPGQGSLRSGTRHFDRFVRKVQPTCGFSARPAAWQFDFEFMSQAALRPQASVRWSRTRSRYLSGAERFFSYRRSTHRGRAGIWTAAVLHRAGMRPGTELGINGKKAVGSVVFRVYQRAKPAPGAGSSGQVRRRGGYARNTDFGFGLQSSGAQASRARQGSDMSQDAVTDFPLRAGGDGVRRRDFINIAAVSLPASAVSPRWCL